MEEDTEERLVFPKEKHRYPRPSRHKCPFDGIPTTELPIFREPQCLIDTDSQGQLQTEHNVLEQIKRLDKALVIVAIAGLYRTGKSYLMNRLAGKSDGFALGSTIQSKTKGIWLWALPHPKQEDKYLLLLDTEGLGDAEKGDENHDNLIFSLATLLSSTLVYNAVGAINDDALAKLNFILEISKYINVTTDGNDEGIDYDCFFPLFIFVLRDFCLDLELHGNEISSDEYLEHCLCLKNDDQSEDARRYNRPRLCIRRYFRNRKCYTFDRPVSRKKMVYLDRFIDAGLSEDFREDAKEFCSYVYEQSAVKQLASGQTVNGPMFAMLVVTYVDAIRDGTVPCIENATKSLSLIENQRTVEGALECYKTKMASMVLPACTYEALYEHHLHCLKEAHQFFNQKAFLDEDNTFQNTLKDKLQEAYTCVITDNENASRKKCQEVLDSLNASITLKANQGSYAKGGGYLAYQQDIQQVMEAYRAREDLGNQKASCLFEYHQAIVETSKGVLATDTMLAEKERIAEEERQAALRGQREQQAAQEALEKTTQRALQTERTLQEQQRLLEQKHSQDTETMRIHYEKVLQDRLNEQQRLLHEGFAAEAAKLGLQVDELKRRAQQRRGTRGYRRR